ncbi:MAG: DegV family protein [Patescibacteria group bacterium]
MKSITHREIRQMFLGAYTKVRDNRSAINKINVFPVPDQDTGDNLTRTLKGIHDALEKQRFDHIKDLATVILDAALTSAAGNVGIIVTSFFNGFLSLLPLGDINGQHIQKAFKEGTRQSIDSIQDPQEGTILDVIQAASNSFENTAHMDNLILLFTHMIKESRQALAQTETKMELYKKATVVDAGGYGFLLIMEGFLDGLENKKTLREVYREKKESGQKRFIQILSNRYEVVSLLQSPRVSRGDVVDVLHKLGDSIDIVEANNKMKIHIHTDYPDEIIGKISSFGTVLQMRTHDMTEGMEQSDTKEKTTGLVTDEGASLPLGTAVDLDIVVVPFQSSWAALDSTQEMTGKNIYEKMRCIKTNSSRYGWPKTSQPSQKLYYQAFQDQLRKYDTVLCITLSSQLSGTYNSAVQARKMLSPKDRERVYIPDLRQAGGGQGILLFEAYHLIKKQYRIDQILKHMQTISHRISVFGIAKDMAWMVEGGRISKLQGTVMQFLSNVFMQPVFHLRYGKIALKGFVPGRKNLSRVIYNEIKKKYNGKKLKLVLSHADNPEETVRLKEKLKYIDMEILYEGPLSPVLGIHTGPDSLICAVL